MRIQKGTTVVPIESVTSKTHKKVMNDRHPTDMLWIIFKLGESFLTVTMIDEAKCF